MSIIKTFIQSILSVFGVRLSRILTEEQRRHIAEVEQRKTLWLRNMEVKTIIDIGANTGQFARVIYQIFPNAMLYAFEPLKDCYEELAYNFKDFPHFQAFNLALGNETGKIEMYRNEFSPSSSLLPMAELHKESFPFARKELLQEVDIVRLDDIANQLTIQKPMLIKIDVQGLEDQVIAGGKDVISQADIILIELSIEPLYKNQPLFNEVYQILLSLGFQYGGNYDQLCSPHDGEILQVDGIFIKK